MIDQNQYTTLVVILNLLLQCVINFRRAKAVITELSKPAPVSKSLRFATQSLNRFARNCLLGHGNRLNSVGQTGVIHPAVRPLFTSTMAVMFGTVLIGTKGDIQQVN